MAAVADVVAHQVAADADVGIALEARAAAECLGVLESSYDQGEAVLFSAPAVGLVAQCDEVGPSDDEAVGADTAALRVAGYVGLRTNYDANREDCGRSPATSRSRAPRHKCRDDHDSPCADD